MSNKDIFFDFFFFILCKHDIMLMIGSVNMLIKFVVSLVTYIFYVVFKTQKQVYILKNAKYKSKKYLEEIKNIKRVWLEPVLFSLLLFIFMFYQNNVACMIVFILIYMISALFLLHQNKKIKSELSGKDKKCMLITLLWYLLLGILFVSIYVEEYITMYFLVLSFVAYMNPIWVLLYSLVSDKPSRKKKK